MFRYGIAVLFMGLVTTSAWAKLEVRKIQACYGPLGPERKNMTYYPFDNVVIRFVVVGAQTDAAGKVNMEISTHLRDSIGRDVFTNQTPVHAVIALGGGTYPTHITLNLPARVTGGTYTLRITLKDKLSSEEVSFERKLKIRPTGFEIVAAHFSCDAEDKIPAPGGGVLGQTLHFRFRISGFDRSRGKVHTEARVQILDKEGKGLLPKPLRFVAENNDPQKVKDAGMIQFTAGIPLNRVGDYTLQVAAKDLLSKRTTTFETPLRVVEP